MRTPLHRGATCAALAALILGTAVTLSAFGQSVVSQPPPAALLSTSVAPMATAPPSTNAPVAAPAAASAPTEPPPSPIRLGPRSLFVEEGDTALLPAYQERQLRWAMGEWQNSPVLSETDVVADRIRRVVFPDPEHIAYRHVMIGGGVVTAIKKKNPLALVSEGLLNQNIFSISW